MVRVKAKNSEEGVGQTMTLEAIDGRSTAASTSLLGLNGRDYRHSVASFEEQVAAKKQTDNPA
jgi:hypothetical protein